MIKTRDANYCNLKLLLMFCVIYGHFIESDMQNSQLLLAQYKLIYMFHMPLFVFLSGLFLNTGAECLRQIKRLLPRYILYQSIAVLLGAVSEASTPWWILWYLFSYCIWAALGILWFRIKSKRLKRVWLLFSIAAGAAVGYIQSIDRAWSASRTIVFLPYFLAGLGCKPDINWRKYRIWGIIAFVAAICAILRWENEISANFLYHATSFGESKNGVMLRLVCYGIGSLIGLFLLTNISGKRFPFTKAGADTMSAYLFHPLIIMCFGESDFPWIVYAGLTTGFLYCVNKVFQWYGTLFGIIPAQRRGRSVWVSGNIRET